MNRRTFIAKGSAGAASAVTAAAVAKQGFAKNSPNDTVNVAVLGINGRGKNHCEYFSRVKNVKVTHIVDPDSRLFTTKVPALAEKINADPEAKSKFDPECTQDLRAVLANKDVDVISVATPDHWHALATVWGCQAGKDVYVEKPVSHNIYEGRKMVEAARKYNRVVGAGTQARSSLLVNKAIKFVHDGGIGDVYMAKAFCYRTREPIGVKPEMHPPSSVDYDLWLGPANWEPYTENKVHYNWHWMWQFGAADTGNQGPHQMDIMRWGINKREHPSTIKCVGRLREKGAPTDQSTHNIQYTTFEYDDGLVAHFDTRGWYTPKYHDGSTGNEFYGSEGWIRIMGYGAAEVFLGRKNTPGPSWTAKELRGEGGVSENQRHFQNYIDCVRSRDWQALNCDILEGHMSASMCQQANLSGRLGRELHFDSHSEQYVNDDQANGYLSRNYRSPYTIPENV
jgi:predicted dehydrogenase